VDEDMTHKPKDKAELSQLLEKLIEERGYEGNFNDIDTSLITDMSGLFQLIDFNGDISEWDVSNVTDMTMMFAFAGKFNQDISYWDVSNVKDMECMFYVATSFNGDISSWNVSNVVNMRDMFRKSVGFNQDLSKWNVSNVRDMDRWLGGAPIEYKAKIWFPEFYIWVCVSYLYLTLHKPTIVKL
jgi:surface protein